MSKCKITGKVLSIRIGREDIQIALIGGNNEIQYSTVVATPAGAVDDGLIRNKEAVCAVLRAALKAPEIKHVRRAVFALCTSQVIAETVTTPDLPLARLEKLLQANVDMYFPVDMQDYQMVWQVIGPKANDSGLKELSVQLWAVPNAMIAMYYSVANTCGLSVLAIDYCGHSVATAVGATYSRQAKAGKAKQKINWNQDISLGSKKKVEPEISVDTSVSEVKQAIDTELYVSLERDLLGMTFVQNKQVVFQRFIPCGADPAYQFSELAMMLEYFYSLNGSRGNMIRGFVTGVLSADAPLVAELEDAIGVSLAAFSAGYVPHWTICVGAAHTALDFGNAVLNRPTKTRKRVQTQIWQYALVLGSGFALIAVIMFTLSAKLTWDSDLKEMESNRQILAIQAQLNIGNADKYNKYNANYDNYSADWDSVFSSLWTYNNNLVLVLQELEEALPEKSSVVNLQIAADGITVEFACENKEEAAYLIMALRKLKYADLKSISNLSGGGSGPATSYGPEKAPTEGSSDMTIQEDSPLFKLITEELSQEELMELSASLTTEEIFLLETAYSKQPTTNYSGIEALKNGNAEMDPELFFKIRSDGLREMLTTNPFAINRFSKLLDDEFYRPKEEQYLLQYILADIFRLQDEGLFGGEGNDAETTLKQMNAMVDVLTKDPETLGHAEDLFATDEVMERWYVYYIELQLNMQQRTEYPYLDRDKVIDDLLDGGFNTGDDTLNGKLNGLISEETRTLLSSVSTEEGMTELMNKYLDEGTTGNTNADAIIEAYLTTGTTGNTRLDGVAEGYINGGAMDAKVGTLIDKYINEGSTGNQTVDALAEKYFTEGTTGNPKMDAIFEKHIDSISSGFTKEQVAELVNKYISDGTTGNVLYDKLIEKYFTEGTTGNDQLDKLISEYMKELEEENSQGGFTKDQVADMMNKYVTDGSTGNALYDKLIEKYLAEGTTGNAQLDNLIDEYLQEAGGSDSNLTKAQIAELMDKYLKDGSTGNDLYDMMIKKYLTEGTTGNAQMDKLIEDYLKEAGGSGSGLTKDQIGELMNKYMTEGTTGNDVYDMMIKKYLTEGTTGNTQMDKLIEEYLKEAGGSGGSLTKEQIGELMNKYLKDGTTGNALYDTMIEKYIKEGTTGNTQMDKLIDEYLKEAGGSCSSLTKEQIGELMNKYLKDGTTGNALYDTMIKKYLTEGTTGNATLDKLIGEYMDEVSGGSDNQFTKEQIAELVGAYIKNGTTGNELYDMMIEKYIAEGTTGNEKLDKMIDEYMKDLKPEDSQGVVSKEQLKQMMDKYLEEGTTGNPLYDSMIEKYFKEGTTGNKKLDEMVDACIDAYIESGMFDEIGKDQMDQMLDNYISKGTTGNKVFDYMIDRYLSEGSTGNAKIDKLIAEYLKGSIGGGNGGSGNGGTGNGGTGNGGSDVTDTRVHFTASFDYNDELKNAELDRKGLNQEDKIEKLEVLE